MKRFVINAAAALALCAFCGASLAASSGIRSSKKNECDEWLCIPGGFAGECGASFSAMVGRITDRGRHGRRNYTTLPSFGQCIEKAQDQAEYKAVEKQASEAGGAFAEAWGHYAGSSQGSSMTYGETSVAYIPAHRECLLVREHNGERSGEYCAGWKNVPEKYVDGVRCEWNYSDTSSDSTTSIGSYAPYELNSSRTEILRSLNRPAYCTDTIHRLTVYADGSQYGQPYDYTEKEPAYSGPRPW